MTGSRPRFRTSPGTRRWWRPCERASRSEAALALDAAVTALGRHPDSSCRSAREAATVPLNVLVGTVSRSQDFDRLFRPRNEALRERWERLASLPANAAPLPPVSLIRVGELYFVEDGHHRVSVARARGQLAIDGHVRQVCTIAYACACLTYGNLANKAAERDFSPPCPCPTLSCATSGSTSQRPTRRSPQLPASGATGRASPLPTRTASSTPPQRRCGGRPKCFLARASGRPARVALRPVPPPPTCAPTRWFRNLALEPRSLTLPLCLPQLTGGCDRLR